MSTITTFNRDTILGGVLYRRGALWPGGQVSDHKERQMREHNLISEVDISHLDSAPKPQRRPSTVPEYRLRESRERVARAKAELNASKEALALLEEEAEGGDDVLVERALVLDKEIRDAIRRGELNARTPGNRPGPEGASAAADAPVSADELFNEEDTPSTTEEGPSLESAIPEGLD